MNIHTAVRTLAVAAFVAAGLGVGAAQAGQPAPNMPTTVVTEGQTRISTDKMTYLVGEPITIRYYLPAKGYMRVTDYQGETVTTLRSGYRTSTEGSIQGRVTPPAGKECLTLEYSPRPLPATPPDRAALMTAPSGQGPAYAETCFEVKDKETAPEQMFSEQILVTLAEINIEDVGIPLPVPILRMGRARWEVEVSYAGRTAATLCFPNPSDCKQYGRYTNGFVFPRTTLGMPLSWRLSDEAGGPLPDELTVTVRAYQYEEGVAEETKPASVTWRRPQGTMYSRENLKVRGDNGGRFESELNIQFETFRETKAMTNS